MNAPPCPTCGGPRTPNRPAGLVYTHSPACPIGLAEDGTKAADHERSALGPFVRPATDAERMLLASLGITLALDAVTAVERYTDGGAFLSRTWAGVDVAVATP